jgi:hypothetical protein
VLVMLLTAGSLGLCCLLEADHGDDHGVSPDLCLTALSVWAPAGLLSGLLALGWAASAVALPIRSIWITVLTPPPRSL